MVLSIICPTYNEIEYIERLFDSLNDKDGVEKEILFADGGSTDGTVEFIRKKMEKHAHVKLVSNPYRTATHGFNLAFREAKGRYIAFVGAHAEYHSGYFKVAVDYLERKECDVVGGPLIQQGKTEKGKAIALAMSSKFGVGNTSFRTEQKKMIVDSVAFAVYNRMVFEQCGLMDETLSVNQDDEFHYRLNAAGFKIMMTPEMSSTYYVRESFPALFKQYFRYGLFKPLVLKRVSSGFRLRHIVPSLFVAYLIAMPFLINLHPILSFGVWLYLLSALIISFKSSGSLNQFLYIIPVFPILHIAYGMGFLLGMIKRK
jgi:succinoglycan biosynthesis protein ExoA